MCELNRCPYEEDEHMQCVSCPYGDDNWDDSDYVDCDDYDDFDLYDFDII